MTSNKADFCNVNALYSSLKNPVNLLADLTVIDVIYKNDSYYNSHLMSFVHYVKH